MMILIKRLNRALTALTQRLKTKPELGKPEEFCIYPTCEGCIEFKAPDGQVIKFEPDNVDALLIGVVRAHATLTGRRLPDKGMLVYDILNVQQARQGGFLSKEVN